MVKSKKDCVNSLRLGGWIITWALSHAVTMTAIHSEWLPTGMPSMLAIAGSLLIGICMLFAFYRNLRELDELQRKIQLEALAATVGVSLLMISVCSLLVDAAVLEQLEGAWVISFICVTYSAAVALCNWRYQ